MKKVMYICLITLSIFSACFLYPDYEFDNPYDPKNNEDKEDEEDQEDISALPYGSIQIDGNTSDWASIPALITDETGELTESGEPMVPGGDIMEIKAVQDADNIYFFIASANGVPLSEPGVEISLNLNGPEDSINVGLSHRSYPASEGIIETYCSYNYKIDEENWNTLDILNPGIRYSGINPSSDTMEVGIAKAIYWESIPERIYSVEVGTWYSHYEDLHPEKGGLDTTSDDGQEKKIILRAEDEAIPRLDSPIVNFPRGSIPTIDGDLSDLSLWSENGCWYQDMTGDEDPASTDDNMDIDKVYIKQDDENIYFLFTFFDAGTPNLPCSINIHVQSDDGSFSHDFYAEYNSFADVKWNTPPATDSANCKASVAAGLLELQFDKSLPWSYNIPSTPLKFTAETSDYLGSPADHIIFYGSYRANGDPTPNP